MSLEALADRSVLQEWIHAMPPDFFPAPPELARVSSGEDGWIRLQFSDSAPSGPSSFRAVRAAMDLPPGTVLLKPLDRRISFSAPVPFGMDVHWLKELAEGVLRGAAGVRVHSAGTVTVRGEWTSDWLAGVTREHAGGEDGLRIVVVRRWGRAAAADADGLWELRAEAGTLTNPRDVAAALLGIHPLQQVRGLLKDLGSKRVEAFVSAAGATLRAFDAVREFWQQMGSRAEAALWELLQRPDDWSRFSSFVRAVAEADEHSEDVAGGLSTLAAEILPDGLAPLAASALEELAGKEPQTGWLQAARGLVRLLERDGVDRLLLALPAAVNRAEDCVHAWVLERLEEIFGASAPEGSGVPVKWETAARRLAAPAALAVEKQWRLRLAAGISACRAKGAVADATFRFTEEGLKQAAAVAHGDLSPLLLGGPGLLRLRGAVLTESAARRCFIELHAPMLRARRKQRDLESFTMAEARATEDGRVQVLYSAQATDVISADLRTQSALVFSAALANCEGGARRDHFSLSFTDRRQLDPSAPQHSYLRVLEAYGLRDVRLPGEPCTALLHLRLPGVHAETWMRTPPPGTAEYLPVLGRAAQAVQAMARRWLPALYLARVEAYSRPSVVHPLLAWASSPPGSGPRKKDLSYDFMDPKVVEEVVQACAPAFRERLEETWRFLSEAGRKQTAAYYEPADTRYILANVRRQQRNFVSLLTADAFLVEAVLNVADGAREVERLARIAPKAAVTEMARFARAMAETFHRKLRRLYAGDDFLALGPLFFLSATSALAGAQGCDAEIAAVLTLEWSSGKASYANEAARRVL